MRQRWLVIFVKAPAPGRVKTRLGRDIGQTAAAWWFRHQIARLVRRVGHDRRWRTVLAVAPDRALGARNLPAGTERIAQGNGDLGARMDRVLGSMPPGPVVIIGADIPDISAANVEQAFRALGRKDAVIGPARDGGYWLIGLARGRRAKPAGLFRDVRWSGPEAMQTTIASLGDLSLAKADVLSDVDTVVDIAAADIRAPMV